MGLKIVKKIQDDLRKALLARESLRVSTLRMVIAAVKNLEIEKRGRQEEVRESDIEATLKRELKKRKEAAEAFLKGGRGEMAAKEEAEAVIIKEYLPEEMGEVGIRKIVEEVIASGENQFGRAMKKVMEKTEKRAEGSLVAKIVKEKLG